jgi:hypothetical protein
MFCFWYAKTNFSFFSPQHHHAAIFACRHLTQICVIWFRI